MTIIATEIKKILWDFLSILMMPNDDTKNT